MASNKKEDNFFFLKSINIILRWNLLGQSTSSIIHKQYFNVHEKDFIDKLK